MEGMQFLPLDELVEIARKHIPEGGLIMFTIAHPQIIAPVIILGLIGYAYIQSKRRKSEIDVIGELRTTPLSNNSGTIGTPIFAEISVAAHKFDAKNVRATIKIYNGKGNFSMRGRWSNSKERTTGVEPRDQEVRNISVDYPEPMLVALKYREKEEAYGVNRHNENMPRWEDESKKISKGEHRIEVIFEGSNIKPHSFTLTLNNRGVEEGLEWVNSSTSHKGDSQAQ